jgi:hypothetical protein
MKAKTVAICMGGVVLFLMVLAFCSMVGIG